ncbi:MAG TPA: PQQ-dependent sugar dehydrogenase, partial [Dehalococcoidia bacterium]|nr:PQQ-dependent sugar dehydrogenase [Dehalococcoidia bacterium]
MKALLQTRGPAAFLLLITVVLALSACGGGDGEEKLPFGLQTEVVTPADHVSDMVFAPDGRMFYAEQYTGAIRVISANGKLQEAPFAQVAIANYLNLDWGLTGLALDPNFQTSHYVYAFYTAPAAAASALPGRHELVSVVPPIGDSDQPVPQETPAGPAPLPPGGATFSPTPQPQPSGSETPTPQPQQQPVPPGQPVLVRWTDVNGTGEEETTISSDFPATSQGHPGYNAQGNIHFGPDKML